ncbi:MAG: glycosyltransferase family 39 protein [Holophagaceae bacterium]|nr:glycosyltransferase family 39 protein [Holophagaceae bacterium]
MDEVDEFSEHRETRIPGQRLGEWVRENRIVILYGILLIAVISSRGSWGGDERRISDLTWDLLNRGSWSPQELGESSILYLWLTKIPAALAGLQGSGSASGFPAWPLRLPSILGSILFLCFFRRWASRFLQGDVAGLATLILCSTPIWFWQSQAIQVDLLYSALLAWSWLSWLAGYLLLRRQAEGQENEHRSWFRKSPLWLGLAFLIKGPQPLLFSSLLLLLFLVWQADLKALKETLLNRGFFLLAAVGVTGCAWNLVPVPGFKAVLQGFSSIQSPWIYAEYLVRDLFPWALLLPALVIFLRGSGAHKAPIARFLILAFLVPFSSCLWGDGTRGTDPLMAYPFLALLLAGLLQPVYVEGVSMGRIRRIGAVMATALWLASIAFFAVCMVRLGGAGLQAAAAPMLGPLRLATLVLALGALSVSVRCANGEGEFLVRETAATVCVVFFIIGTWGFRGLDSKLRSQINAKDPMTHQLLK